MRKTCVNEKKKNRNSNSSKSCACGKHPWLDSRVSFMSSFSLEKNSFFINLGYSHFFHSLIDSLFSPREHKKRSEWWNKDGVKRQSDMRKTCPDEKKKNCNTDRHLFLSFLLSTTTTAPNASVFFALCVISYLLSAGAS